MTEYETPSGLAVVERAQTPPPDAEPPVNVHGHDSALPHDEHSYVMYPAVSPPLQASRWDGWPVGWVPPWDNWSSGLAQRVSTVFACIDLNARTLATMPPYVTRDGQTLSPPTWLRNPEPEIYTGWVEFLKLCVASYQLRGEVFIWATAHFADGFPARFVVLNPDWVSVDFVDGRREYAIGGERLDTRDVLHVRYSTWPGDARGHGPLEAGARNLLSAEAMERYGANLATRGGVPWAVLKHPANLSATQAQTFRDRWVAGSQSRDGAPAVLSGGIDLEVLSLSPKDMALLDLRQFDEGRICALLGVPPFLVGLPSGGDSMTYSNVSSLFDFHWRATLRPIATALSDALSNWALPGRTGVEFNRDEYVRPGLGERAQAYSVLHNIVDPVSGARAITVDEIRAAERLEDSDNVDSEGVVAPAAVVLSGGDH